jgi:obg-like ATPase 1
MLPLFDETTAKIKAVRTLMMKRIWLASLKWFQMLEADKPVRDGSWTTAEIELINERVCSFQRFISC